MRTADVLIIGSGFSGALMAMILRRLGRTVALLDRAVHPRFAIGESSTPLANLALETLAERYDLPGLRDFSKWGRWQTAHPGVACGLKRGFTFYQHALDEAFPFGDRDRQLLVAASPNDSIADTHWYRPDFDAHLAAQARDMGAELIEGARFSLRRDQEGWVADGEAGGRAFAIRAGFLVDASGARGCLFRHFGMGEDPAGGFLRTHPKTETLFAHFRGVRRLDPPGDGLPYPPDDAAVHHLFDGGWIWVLHFNNGLTSAGVAAVESDEWRLQEGATAWHRLLNRLPSVARQFADAAPVTPFRHQRPMAFRAARGAGPGWAMLPSAMGFVDPLLSTGFALTLFGIERLARLFENGIPTPNALLIYEQACLRELDAAGRLVAALYATMADFPAFTALSRLYFAAASFSETRRRLGRSTDGFLMVDHPGFGPEMDRLCQAARQGVRRELPAAVERLIAPFDVAGLTDPTRRNWHPALAGDLFAAAPKLNASPAEIQALLLRCGFAPSPVN